MSKKDYANPRYLPMQASLAMLDHDRMQQEEWMDMRRRVVGALRHGNTPVLLLPLLTQDEQTSAMRNKCAKAVERVYEEVGINVTTGISRMRLPSESEERLFVSVKCSEADKWDVFNNATQQVLRKAEQAKKIPPEMRDHPNPLCTDVFSISLTEPENRVRFVQELREGTGEKQVLIVSNRRLDPEVETRLLENGWEPVKKSKQFALSYPIRPGSEAADRERAHGDYVEAVNALRERSSDNSRA